MDTNEPTGYENEPDEVFSPLPADLYPTVFHIETEQTREDCRYYHQILKEQQSRSILELGCGTGRIQEYLYEKGWNITGIDYSREMLRFSRKTRYSPTAEMDMRRLGFSCCFDTVLIPHNTLNLIGSINDITSCLMEVRHILNPGGILALHLFVPDKELLKYPGKRHFQFSLFDILPKKKLIKETIRVYSPEKEELMLEERYKFRSINAPEENRDFSHCLKLAAYSFAAWKQLLKNTGFRIITAHGDFSNTPFLEERSSMLVIKAQTSS